MYTLYNLGIYVYGLLIYLASFFNEKAKKRYRGQREALKTLKDRVEDGQDYIWFHAASLGEFEQARPLIEGVKVGCSRYKILLTFFSPSGYEVRKDYKGADIVCYMPLDTIRNVRKFYGIIKPKRVVFVKYEFWPNFLIGAWRKHIPLYIVSAHFRESQAFFKWYGKPYAMVLRMFDRLFVQDEKSVELLSRVGVKNVSVTGDTRFDRVAQIAEQRKSLPIVESFANGEKIIVAGSSWPADEDMLVKYAKKRGVRVLLAPHEIDEGHLGEIEGKWNATEGGNWPIIRYSKANEANVKEAGCLVVDNFGMLSSVYYYGAVAYIGGGFGVGIHNVLEAAVYGMPVVFGPNHNAFREALGLKECGGGFSVDGYEDFEGLMDRLIADPSKAGEAAGNYVKENRGATEMILRELIMENL